MNKYINILLLVFSSSAFINAYAAPSPGINYLMDEPVSLFDYGSAKLEKHLDAFLESAVNQNENGAHSLGFKGGIYSQISIRYDWDTNQLVIYGGIRGLKGSLPSKSELNNACKLIIGYFRKALFAGESEWLRRNGGLYSYYAHSGYVDKNEPKDLMKQVEAATVIEAQAFSGDLAIMSTCKGPLMGKEIFILEDE